MSHRIKSLKNETDSRAYRIKLLNSINSYCFICKKRAGNYYSNCSPFKKYGIHGSKKIIYSNKYREFKSWKYQRKKQYLR